MNTLFVVKTHILIESEVRTRLESQEEAWERGGAEKGLRRGGVVELICDENRTASIRILEDGGKTREPEDTSALNSLARCGLNGRIADQLAAVEPYTTERR